MTLPRFMLHQPRSVDEILQLRGQFGEDASLYAGGTELLAAMKMGVLQYQHLIDVKRVSSLGGIGHYANSVRIGATATHHEIENHPAVVDELPALAELERHVANVRVRAAGTLAGNLAFGEPHADPPALLVALGAKIVVQGGKGDRFLHLEEFCVGAYETALGEDELIVGIDVPIPPSGERAAYEKFQVLERPSVGVAAAGEVRDGVFVKTPRLVIGAVDETPRSVVVDMLTEASIDDETTMNDAGDAAAAAVEPVDDLSGSAEYKRHLVRVLTKRVLRKLDGGL